MSKKKKWFCAVGLLLLLCLMCQSTVMAKAKTKAKAKTTKVSLDKYLIKRGAYDLYAYNSKRSGVPIYQKKSLKGGIYGHLGYGDAIMVQKSKLKKGVKTAWIPVYMANTGQTAYLQARTVKLKEVYTKRYSKNSIVDNALRCGVQHLGTPFELGYASLESRIDCANFVKACYERAGRGMPYPHTDYLQRLGSAVPVNSLQPGDLLFYLKYDTHGPIDHVAIYLGEGFAIQSSGHYGTTYPFGGICVKRVNYGNRKPVLCKRFL